MDVARVLKGDPYQEFRKEEGLEGLQASARGAKLVCKSTKRDHHHYSSEDDVTFVPVSQQNGSLTHQKMNVSHITAVNEFP
ncbi:unnamed protein product [Sphagnum troendelagicum]|uniref:Uncharacterized protein n=1 Tax=Sphagnum troendelagicum TaxID=128251 RepID=A0ABP0TYK5_9BRYO